MHALDSQMRTFGYQKRTCGDQLCAFGIQERASGNQSVLLVTKSSLEGDVCAAVGGASAQKNRIEAQEFCLHAK